MSQKIDYDRQEEFLEQMIDSLSSLKANARREELFESVDDIIIEVKEIMELENEELK
tara:strand:- start:10717 stop:10887 length:171 start_codon:yes stop_codon:yes gene_type:complete